MSYYNTTNLKHSELSYAVASSKGQDERILEFFRSHPGQMFSPEDIHRIVFSDSVPLTSTRRSITTLTDGLFLERTDMKVIGKYGKPIYLWKLKTNNNQPTLF